MTRSDEIRDILVGDMAREAWPTGEAETLLVTARNDRYAINLPRRDGPVLQIVRSWDPARVKRGARAQYREQAATFAERWDPAYGFNAEVPREKPPFWAFRIDEEDRP